MAIAVPTDDFAAQNVAIDPVAKVTQTPLDRGERSTELPCCFGRKNSMTNYACITDCQFLTSLSSRERWQIGNSLLKAKRPASSAGLALSHCHIFRCVMCDNGDNVSLVRREPLKPPGGSSHSATPALAFAPRQSHARSCLRKFRHGIPVRVRCRSARRG